MVRKATRSTIKAAEKSKTESPKRTRNKGSNQHVKSDSRSDTDDDVPLSITKTLSPSRADKGSSGNESDKDSKKPLKKRSRSMAIKEETQQPSSHKSRWDKQPKSPPPKTIDQDKDEEVIEELNSKGKSKNKNKSNNDNVVNPETENENMQVTDESPSDAKDDNHDTQAKNGEENRELIDVNTSNASDAAKTSDQQASEVSVEETEEATVAQDNASDPIVERASRSPSKEATDKSSDKHKSSDRRGSRERKSSEQSKDSDKERDDENNRKSMDRRSSERATKDSIEQKTEHIQHSEKSDDSKKIKLKRPPTDKRTSEIEDKEVRKEENGTRKKIILKRLENKQPVIEESKTPAENHESSPKEQPQPEEWISSYETNNETRDKQGKPDEKPARKRITLKRSTVEDNKLSATIEKKEISFGRSISLHENRDQRRSSTSENTTTPEEKKRRSSVVDRSTSENEEKPQVPKKPTKVVKLNRNLPQEPQEPPPPGEETLKKYKWGRSDISYTDVETLNLDTLKQVCPNIEFLKEDEVNLDVVIKENIPHKERRKTFTELEEEEMEKIEAELNAEPEEIEIKENIIAMNRKISIVEDTASKLKPPPSPARNPVSEVLFITNLVRPFTVKQLKELLERTGKIMEDGFWTDRIKSKCYVYYEKIEEAEATRNALHGVNWPIGNGKKLIIDYATVNDLENAKNPPIPVKKEKSPEKENKKPVIEDEKDDKKSIRTVKRDWDLGKEDDHRRRRSRSRSSRERQRKHSRRSYTPEDYHGKKKKHEEPAPQKAMDDLFLKTKATPSIYWQPLSPEEIALKQQQRQARLEENKRRLEEISRTSTRGTHRDRGRDRNFRRR